MTILLSLIESLKEKVADDEAKVNALNEQIEAKDKIVTAFEDKIHEMNSDSSEEIKKLEQSCQEAMDLASNRLNE